MIKKIISIGILAISSNVYAETEHVIDPLCEIQGTVDLPYSFLGDNSYVGIYDISTKINEKGEFCFKEKIKHRSNFNLYVSTNDTIVLQNPISRGLDDFNNIKLDLAKAVAYNTCDDELCSPKDVEIHMRLKTVHEYGKYLKNKYYKTYHKKFDYSKIEKKMRSQKRDVAYAKKREIVDMAGDTYFPLDLELKATNYKSFNYKSSVIRRDQSFFIGNSKKLQGLDKADVIPDIILTHWLRYLYYYGPSFKDVGALYSKDYKESLVESKDYERPLKFAKLYQNNLRNGTKVRGTKDEKYFEDTTEELKGLFAKKGQFIFNIKPEYVNIEFIFEDGAWRLNTFDVNDKYLKSL